VASREFTEMRRAGFSENFLRTSAGAPTVLRRAYLRSPDALRRCRNCHDTWADPLAVTFPCPDKKERDLRYLVAGSKPRRAGFCSMKCACEHYGTGEREALRKLRVFEIATAPDFYDSRHWKEIRYEALRRDGARCLCCGRTRADGVVLHVDHIRPRYTHPELALSAENLQVLCAECNVGKGWQDDTDWRRAPSGR